MASNTETENNQMNIWSFMVSDKIKDMPDSKVIDLKSKLTTNADSQKSVEKFHKIFKLCKEKNINMLVTSSLFYKFSGNDDTSTAEWIGVPWEDRVYYISPTGRVAVTGTPF